VFLFSSINEKSLSFFDLVLLAEIPEKFPKKDLLSKVRATSL